MLVLAHPHGTSSSEYYPTVVVPPGPPVASLKNSNCCPTLAASSQQRLYSSMLQPASVSFPLHPRQLRLQSREVLPVAVQGPAASASGSLYPNPTVGVSGLLPCAPGVVRSSPQQQPLLHQTYVSQLPATVSVPLAPSVCALPSTTVLSTAGLLGAANNLTPIVPSCLLSGPRGQEARCARAAGEQQLQHLSKKASKEKRRLLHTKSEGLCEREEKFQQQCAFTLEQQQEESQQRDQLQQPPLWRVPLVRDPLAAATADFNPIPVSEATLVRHLWKHAHAAVEAPTSTPPFRWTPSLTDPHPSYWADLRQHNRRLAHQHLIPHGQGCRTGECAEHQHQCVHLQGSRQDAEEGSPEICLRRATDKNTHRSRRRRTSSTASRRSHKEAYEEGEWQTGKRVEADARFGDGEEDAEQSMVLSTRVGRSQSPAYVCPRRDDFTAEQLIDAPAYTTNYMGLLSDTGMHYTKRYELPTISRFLQAKHPVFLRARTPAGERQPQSRLISGNCHGRQRDQEGGSESFITEDSGRNAAGTGVSCLPLSTSPMDTPAVVFLQPQAHLQPDQNHVIIPATPLPTITVSLAPQASPVALAQQHSLELPATDAGTLELLTNKSATVSAVTAATEGSIMGAAVPLCVIPQCTTTSLAPTLQRGIVCPELSSLESGSTLAAAPSPPSLYVQAPTRQEGSAQISLQPMPEACSSDATAHSAFQPPHSTAYAVTSPDARRAAAVVTPCFSPVASDGKAAAAGQPPQHAQQHTDIILEQEKGVEVGPQQEHEQDQGTSEERGRRIVQSFREREQLEQRGELPQQQQRSHALTQGDLSSQPDSREQLSPQRYMVGRESQGHGEREASYEGTATLSSWYLFTPEQSHVLVPSVAVATPQRTALPFSSPLLRGDDDLPGGEANPAATEFPTAQDAGGVCAIGALPASQPTVTLLAGSPLHPGTSIHVPSVNSTVAHPITFLPGGSLGPSISATPVEPRVKAPPERHSQSSAWQWRFLDPSVVTASPTAHVLSQQQQWQPQIFIPTSESAGPRQFVG